MAQNYVEWVHNNPQLATDLENGCKWIFYLGTAYWNKSRNSLLVTELIYKAGNLLHFLNDRVFEKAFNNEAKRDRVKFFLGLIENTEVILELSGRLAGGETGRWLVIVVVQLLKAAFRVALLVKERRMLPHPTLEPVDRSLVKEPKFNRLPRSGRTIRSLDDKDVDFADRPFDLNGNKSNNFAKLTALRAVGEAAYVTEPLLHLAARAKYGSRSWRPWLVSLGADVLGNACHGLAKTRRGGLDRAERAELWRRRTRMLIFLLRSPFYDHYTKHVLLTFLIFARDNVPLGGRLAEVFLSYIPHYRKIHSYLWSN